MRVLYVSIRNEATIEEKRPVLCVSVRKESACNRLDLQK